MPIDKTRPPMCFAQWMHDAIRIAVTNPDVWHTVLDAVSGSETREHRRRELSAKEFAVHSMRKFRAFRRSLRGYPLFPLAQLAEPWEFDVKTTKGHGPHHVQVLVRAHKPRPRARLDLDDIAEQLATDEF